MQNAFKIFGYLCLLVSSFSFAANNFESLLTKGMKLKRAGYKPTEIVELEKTRLPINTTFVSSYDILEVFTKSAQGSKTYNEFYNAMQGKSDVEIEQAFNSLSTEDQKAILANEEANKTILLSIGELALKLYAQKELFASLDVTALAKSKYSMWNLAKKSPAIYSAVDTTNDEISFVGDSVVEIHRISSVLSKFQNAV